MSDWKLRTGTEAYVYWSAGVVALVPSAVVTTTSTVPTAPGGLTAVICVSELTVKVVAALPPKVTDVAPASAVPVIVTLVPPATGPTFGFTPVTTGLSVIQYRLPSQDGSPSVIPPQTTRALPVKTPGTSRRGVGAPTVDMADQTSTDGRYRPPVFRRLPLPHSTPPQMTISWPVQTARLP